MDKRKDNNKCDMNYLLPSSYSPFISLLYRFGVYCFYILCRCSPLLFQLSFQLQLFTATSQLSSNGFAISKQVLARQLVIKKCFETKRDSGPNGTLAQHEEIALESEPCGPSYLGHHQERWLFTNRDRRHSFEEHNLTTFFIISCVPNYFSFEPMPTTPLRVAVVIVASVASVLEAE